MKSNMTPQSTASDKLRYIQSLAAVSGTPQAVPRAKSAPTNIAAAKTAAAKTAQPRPKAPTQIQAKAQTKFPTPAEPESSEESTSDSQAAVNVANISPANVNSASVNPANANPARASRSRYRPFRSQIMESGMVIVANAILATFAVVGMCKLIPYYQEQNQKLKVLEQQVSQTRRRVEQLRTKYQREQQPQTASQIAREGSNLIGVDQQPVIMVTPTRPAAPKPEASPEVEVEPRD
jgi:DNA mismatch repair ATPase MutL